VNDTEENDAFQIDHVRKTQETSETTNDAQQRKADSLARNDTQRNSNTSRTTQTRTSISAFKRNGKPDHDVTDDASKRVFL
jgi:hypothetical protein